MDKILDIFPDATIIKIITGNDGIVYLLDNNIAIKILHKLTWSKPDNIENEAIIQDIVHKLGHAPKVYFYDKKQGIMAMETIYGLTLDEYLKKYPENFREVKYKINTILDILYDNGIIHGDLAGSNIIIDIHGNIQLIDFSSANIKTKPILKRERDYYITGEIENF